MKLTIVTTGVTPRSTAPATTLTIRGMHVGLLGGTRKNVISVAITVHIARYFPSYVGGRTFPSSAVVLDYSTMTFSMKLARNAKHI